MTRDFMMRFFAYATPFNVVLIQQIQLTACYPLPFHTPLLFPLRDDLYFFKKQGGTLLLSGGSTGKELSQLSDMHHRGGPVSPYC